MALAIFSYAVSFIGFCAAYIKFHGFRTVSPLTCFLVIYFMYAGPHVMYFIFWGAGNMPTNLNREEASTLLYCLTISNAGMVLAPVIFKSLRLSVFKINQEKFASKAPLNATAFLAISVSLIFSITLLSLDNDNLQRLQDTISAVLGNSPYSIQQVRREVHADTLSNRSILKFMYFLTGPSLIILLFFALSKRLSMSVRLTCVLSFVFLYAFGFVNTHKQTLMYPFIGIALALLIQWASGNKDRSRKLLFFLLSSPVFATVILTFAYQIQYFALNFGFMFWLDTAAFRLLAQIETPALAIRLYSDKSMFLGISGMGPIADIAGVQRRDPTTELALYFNENGRNTSLQGGFLMTGWAVAGFLGVAVSTLIVSTIVAISSAASYKINTNETRACMQSAIALSGWTFTQMNVSTALLTGGNGAIILTIFILVILERSVAHKKVSTEIGNLKC